MSGLDRFVHPRTLEAGGEALRRSRTAVGILLFFIVALPISITSLLLDDRPAVAGGSIALWALSVGLLLATRRGFSVARAGYLLSGVLVPVAGSTAWTQGGLDTPPVLGLMMLPSLMVFIAGPRAGWVFVPVVAVVFVGLALDASGDLVLQRERLVGLLVLMLVITGSTASFETQRRQLDTERQRAQQQPRPERPGRRIAGVIAIGLSLAGLVVVLGTWILYLRSINRGTVSVRPWGSVAAQSIGMSLALVGIAWSVRQGQGLSMVAGLVPASVALMLGGFFVWLIGQRKTPVGELKLAVGDRLLPFAATTDDGTAFHTDGLAGTRTLLKFFRGGW